MKRGWAWRGTNFVGNAVYRDAVCGKDAAYVAQFELIPWILGRCGSVREAKAALSGMVITGTPFPPQLPTAQLHWMIADREACIVVESTEDGLHIYDNPVGVLTNNPPFPMQLFCSEQLRRCIQQPAGGCICRGAGAGSIQPGHGRHGPPRGFVQPIPICPGCVYPAERPVRAGRAGEREPDVSHPGLPWSSSAAAARWRTGPMR